MALSDIIEHIEALKRIRDATIIAHHYAPSEVHLVADILSDSRGFFEAIADGIDAATVVVIAPTFFAEIAAALLPEKTILNPVKSECPVADHRHLSFDAVSDFKDLHPGIPLVCYATSPLKTKLLADFITLPGEVVQTIDAIDTPEVLFVGEKNCADDAFNRCRTRVTLFPRNPICNVYNVANRADVERLKAQYPDSCLMVHPECKPEVTEVADYVIGTGEMHRLIRADTERHVYILGTELGFFQRMQQEFPERTILHLSPYLVCNVFKVFRIETILSALEAEQHVVHVDRTVAEKITFLFKQLLETRISGCSVEGPGEAGRGRELVY
ncbi:MAG: quinolinate synthase NadA [Anaerolineae bacterium]|nr:quinolinate synthase NadA [Anaerolineae bacterium]